MFKRPPFFISFFLLSFFSAFPQAGYRHLLHKPYSERFLEIGELYEKILPMKDDSAYVNKFTAEMKDWALENGDRELALEAKLLKADYYIVEHGQKKYILELMETIEEENFLFIKARANHSLAVFHWKRKNYEKAFECLLRSVPMLEKANPQKFPDIARYWNYIGRCYYHFHDYEEALIYYEKSGKIEKREYNALLISDAQNTLGLCYQKLNLAQRSDSCFLALINDKSKYAIPIWKSIAKGNLGKNYFLRKEYDKAIPLLKADIESALKIEDYGLATGSTILLAKIYLAQNKPKQSKELMDKAKWYIRTSGQTERLRKLYPVMGKWFAMKGRADSSTVYMDSAIAATNKYNEKYSGLKLMRADQKVREEQKKLKIAKLDAQSRAKLAQRNIWIILIANLLLISILTFVFRNKYLLKKQQLKELELRNSKKNLAHTRERLGQFVKRMRTDQKIIIELQKDRGLKENHMVLDKLKAKNILTNEDWIGFKKDFNEIFPRFISTLKKSFPELTQAETRCLCLEKLGLSNNEMALLLGVSPNSARVTKHRLRKKIGLKEGDDLKHFVHKL